MWVAPKSRASAWRSGCRDIAMIVVAPSRFAAMIAQSPTAPSPTTATESPGRTPAETAAWWPVPITSERVSSPGTWSSRISSRTGTSVPSASGTRTRSPCPPSANPPRRSSPPHQPPCRHDVETPLRQLMQVLSHT